MEEADEVVGDAFRDLGGLEIRALRGESAKQREELLAGVTAIVRVF